jgi:CTP-dependent riboflavin kinase
LKTFMGTVKSGIGKASIEMADADGLADWKKLTGLEILPGTLNLLLQKPFDLSLLKYVSFSAIGWDFDPSTQGHDFNGDVGMHYHRIHIADKYSGIIAFWSWTPERETHAELISPVHLRTVLGLKDGDTVSFSLSSDK